MASPDDIENRTNQIMGAIAVRAGELNDVLDTVIDMLKRSDNPELIGMRMIASQNPNVAKLDLLTDASELIAHAEIETGTRYDDGMLMEKMRADLTELATQMAQAEHGRGGRTH